MDQAISPWPFHRAVQHLPCPVGRQAPSEQLFARVFILLHTKHLEAKVCLNFSPSVVPAVSLWGLGLSHTCFFTRGGL